jgi:hypothetical protein
MLNPDRFQNDRYPQFQKDLEEKILTAITVNLPENIAKIILRKIENDSSFVFNEKEFFKIFQQYISDKLKKIVYTDSPDILEEMSLNIVTKIGAEQTYVIFQFVLAFISLNI